MTQFFKTIFNLKFSILLIIFLYVIISIPIGLNIGVTLLLHWLFLVCLLYLCTQIRLRWVLATIFLIIIFINAYTSLVLHTKIELGIMASVLETDSQEALSAIKDSLLKGLIIFVVSAILVYGAFWELGNKNLNYKYPLALVILYSFCFLPYKCYSFAQKSGMDGWVSNKPLLYRELVNVNAPIVYGNIAIYLSYKDEINGIKKYLDQERLLPQGVDFDDDAYSPNTILLILGESSARTHYSLYGYDVKTTPFLDSLSQGIENSSYSFNYYNAISPASLTRYVVPLIFSFSSYENLTQDFSRYKNILDLANMQGYETIWISNQAIIDGSYSMVGMLASSARRMYIEEPAYSDDLKVVDKLKNFYNKDKKQFIVLHLAGSHFGYQDRYDELDKEAIMGTESNELHYDRSVHHTDRVLREIFQMVQQDPSNIIYYLSDHGEAISIGSHGMAVYKEEFEIPLIILNNSNNIDTKPLIEKYMSDEDSLINSINSIYILSELLGYKVENTIIEKAVAGTCQVYGSGKIKDFRELE